MQVSASLKYLRISPRKVRRVAYLVRGKRVTVAEQQLQFALQRSARPLLKLLRSAAASARDQFDLQPQDLVVKRIVVNEGPILKRSLPRARGKVDLIRKRTSHVEIMLEGQKTQAAKLKEQVKKTKVAPKSSKKPENKPLTSQSTK